MTMLTHHYVCTIGYLFTAHRRGISDHNLVFNIVQNKVGRLTFLCNSNNVKPLNLYSKYEDITNTYSKIMTTF